MNIRLHIAALRVLALAVGTYYVYSGLYLLKDHSGLSGTGTVGYLGAVLGQVVVGVIFVGIGLGVWRIVLNAKAR
jgi:hypothetical protein